MKEHHLKICLMDLKGFVKANYLHGNVTMKFDL